MFNQCFFYIAKNMYLNFHSNQMTHGKQYRKLIFEFIIPVWKTHYWRVPIQKTIYSVGALSNFFFFSVNSFCHVCKMSKIAVINMNNKTVIMRNRYESALRIWSQSLSLRGPELTLNTKLFTRVWRPRVRYSQETVHILYIIDTLL